MGDEIVFPSLDWRHGTVVSTRAGTNPEIGVFDVLTVRMEDGSERLFASNLSSHTLNDKPATVEDDEFDPDTILREHGSEIEKKIESAFKDDEELVRIAGRWFPLCIAC